MAEETSATATSSGLALYRKYRPATFAEVRGQDHVTEPLRQALKSGRINHAYLFSGPRGCGKTSSARILARSLNCVNGPTPDPCGVCESCVALAPSGPGSIDVIEIDAASHGGVDDARDLRERAFYAPVSGRYKIYIIDEAHMVTSQGFNALLKLVEEPPPHLKFIFATTEPDKVIATIRSRTHHYPFRLMPPSVMSGLLTDILTGEGVAFEPAVIPLVVQAGAGSARDSLSILDQLLAGSDENGIRYDRAVALLGYTDASLLDEITDAFAAADGAHVFHVVNRVIEGGHEPRRFATDMLDRFRDLIVLASVPDAVTTGLLNVPPDRVDTMTKQAGWGLAALTRAAEIVSNGLDQMRGATSPRLLLELMCAQVLLPGAATDERSVLARLERLESGAVLQPSFPERVVASPSRPPASGPAESANAGGPVSGAAPASGEGPASGGGPASQRGAPPHWTEERGARDERRATREGGGPERPGGERESTERSGGERGGPGEITTDVLRQDWPYVLEMIKAKRRVAWLMLQNASVVSLDENVLMLRFPRQGDVKGFTTGQYDEMLKQALHARYGVNLVVRAIAGPDSGSAGPGGRGPVDRGPSTPGGPPVSQRGAQSHRTEERGARDERPATREGGGPDRPGGEGDGKSATRKGGVSARPGGEWESRAKREGGGSGRPSGEREVTGGRKDAVPFPSDDDFDPDDEDMSAPVSAELTGMALVQRELGGEIIGEFED
jgi:DNA polymerase-3 subunit gamma/tau